MHGLTSQIWSGCSRESEARSTTGWWLGSPPRSPATGRSTFGAVYDGELRATARRSKYPVSWSPPSWLPPRRPWWFLHRPTTGHRALPASPDTLRILVAVAAFAVVAMFVLILAWGREEEERLGGRLRVYGTPEPAVQRARWDPEQTSHLPPPVGASGGGGATSRAHRSDQLGARLGKYPAPPR